MTHSIDCDLDAWRRYWPSLDAPLTVAERGCRGEGFCVFTLGADRCTICHRTREGKRA